MKRTHTKNIYWVREGGPDVSHKTQQVERKSNYSIDVHPIHNWDSGHTKWIRKYGVKRK